MKTSNSQKKAVRAYEESKDIIRGIFPKGTKDRIISAGYTYNGFLNEAVERFFHDLETPTAPILEPTESVSQIEEETKEVDVVVARGGVAGQPVGSQAGQMQRKGVSRVGDGVCLVS